MARSCFCYCTKLLPTRTTLLVNTKDANGNNSLDGLFAMKNWLKSFNKAGHCCLIYMYVCYVIT